MSAVSAVLVALFSLCSLLLVPAAGSQAAASRYDFTLVKERLTMPDGVELAVTCFMPTPKSPGERFPVLVEMNPYRKDDMMFVWDYPIGAYFARRGFVVARVDVRGTGASGGVLPGRDYSEEELSDGVAVIGLLAGKDWSNGNVGMYGLSWGAFNSLMIAARKPPALKAILIAHASDDLFYQDVHFIDGVFHMDVWEAMMDTFNALPSPEGYALTQDYFSNRFDREPWHFIWKEQQADGPFWRRESARFKPPVTLPVYVIGGLLDGYRDTVPRLLDSPGAVVKAEIGPWSHDWPNTGSPGPNYEWRHKAVRWFNHWLRGEDTGIMDEPRFMVFVRHGQPPAAGGTQSGEWHCGAWPVAGVTARRYHPGGDSDLAARPPAATDCELAYWPGAGMGVHGWWGEVSDDMADDDDNSLVFDSPVLAEPVEIIGLPRVSLRLAARAPLTHVTVRLEDVAPDGTVALVSGVLINPADRVSRLERKALPPGEAVTLAAEIHFTTWRFNPGHRIRLAVGNAQFPMAWPSPSPCGITLTTGPDTWLDLPVAAKNSLTGRCVLPAPEPEEESAAVRARDAKESRAVSQYDQETGVATYSTGDDESFTIGDVAVRRHETNVYSVSDARPAAASYKAVADYAITLPGRGIRLMCGYDLTSDERAFTLSVSRRLSENGRLVREKRWERKIPRNLQ